MSYQNFVCICEQDCNNDSVKTVMEIMVDRSNVLETLSGVCVHDYVMSSCIFLQTFTRRYIYKKKIKAICKNLYRPILLKGFRKFVSGLAGERNERIINIMKNRIKTKYYRKRFICQRNAALLIQRAFKKSYVDISYAKKCHLYREIQYLNQKVESRNYLICELGKKLRREQKQNSVNNRKWYRKNILHTLINTDGSYY